jgi:hypothetical protein
VRVRMTLVRTISIAVSIAMLAGPAIAQSPDETPPPLPISDEPTPLQKTGDVLFVRPLLAVRFVVGVASFAVTWPVAAVLGDSGWAFDVCLAEPVDRLFKRPLGRL